MAKVLITGGCGFIGSNLAAHRIELGDDVTVLDNLSRPGGGSRKNLEYLNSKYVSSNRFHFTFGSVYNLGRVSQAVYGKDIIFHLAAQTAMTTSIDSPHLDFQTNAMGTFYILEAARRRGSNPIILYTSTNKVYGDLTKRKVELEEQDHRWAFRNIIGVDESYPLDYEGPYGCSKGTGDSYMLDYARTYGMRTIVFRMSGIYGTSQHATEDQGWVTWIARQCLKHDLVTIYGDGKQVRDILFINDLLRAMDSAVKNANTISGHPFNIGGGKRNSISLLELLGLLKYRFKIEPSEIKYADWRRADQKIYISDITMASLALDWTPDVGIEEGVGRVIDWLKEERQ
jgi:CDP-paratose 2-epimerase